MYITFGASDDQSFQIEMLVLPRNHISPHADTDVFAAVEPHAYHVQVSKITIPPEDLINDTNASLIDRCVKTHRGWHPDLDWVYNVLNSPANTPLDESQPILPEDLSDAPTNPLNSPAD
ncbi:hypothetical protein JAAARDRAFT_189570 [Jaapia argillacea MUCL 33604]|uniref:Uncharacterized protein n=1 Tax=Jaapia argillacea MUCL 33604 TaxID=933084 RepID=A0A067QHY6_9AGAM|nr:hypothetical protein JAAARDRAFT_189570 [Jaapia argillacea MUCL 33604]